MMILGIALTCGLMVFILLYVFVITKLAPRTQVQQRLRRLKHPAPIGGTPEIAEIPFVERTIVPFFQWIEKGLLHFAPAGIYEVLERRIMLAGKQHIWSVNAFVAVWVLSLVCCLMLGMLLISQRQLAFTQNFIFLLLAVFLGAMLPLAFLDSLIRRRRKLIRQQLPAVLDLLCVSVQAGLAFDSSMQKIVDRMQGPLIDECTKMLRDVRMGMARRTALQNMAKRCDIQEVHLFTTAVIQAERLGTSMSKTLEIQADNMRERRRQSAKAEALKAPVKIIFPLVLFIFPALFVVTLLPTILTLLKGLSHM
jgi:tight adherence protein C